MSSTATLAEVGGAHLSISEDGLRLRWPDGHEVFFHHVWLRDCCYCELCGDSYTSNRFLRPSDVPLDIVPRSAEANGDALVIIWANDGHRSRYPLAWLRRHGYAERDRARRRHVPTLWNAAISENLPSVAYEEAAGRAECRLDLLRKLRDFGFVVVRDGPREDDGILRVASLAGEVAESAYGKLFDLSPRGRFKTLGNTMQPVPPHTDEAYRHSPPGVNVLHCIRPASSGGESVLVDGFQLGALLRERDPEAFRLLATQPQTFHRVVPEDGIDQRSRAPVFVIDEFGAIAGFRFHTRTAAPLDAPADLVPALFAANHALSHLMMDEANQACFRLGAGDAVLFDNQRVMHSRKGFADPQRWLRICNVSREQFHQNLRLTARELGFEDEVDMVLGAGLNG